MSMDQEDNYSVGMDPEDNYENEYRVGYKKPPKATQFQKGSSGNPKGRPKASTSPDALLARELNKQITITENGRRKRITKSEAFVMQMVNKAISGHSTSSRHLHRYNERLQIKLDELGGQPAEREEANPEDFTDAQLAAIVQQGFKAVRNNKPDDEDDG